MIRARGMGPAAGALLLAWGLAACDGAPAVSPPVPSGLSTMPAATPSPAVASPGLEAGSSLLPLPGAAPGVPAPSFRGPLTPGPATAAPSGPTVVGSVYYATLTPGTCLDTTRMTGVITYVDVIDCASPHDGEVYAVVPTTATTWPGDQAMAAEADAACAARFTAFAGVPVGESRLDFYYLYPLQPSFEQEGHRSIICIAHSREPVRGPLKNAAD